MKLILCLTFCISFVFSSVLLENQNFLLNHYQQSILTKKDVENQYNEYKKIYDTTLTWYKNEIKKKWPNVEISSKEFYVSYQNNFFNKTTIDYRNGIIYFYTISDNEKLAADTILGMFQRLMKLDVNKALLDDTFQNKLLVNLNKIKSSSNNSFLLVGDLFSKNKQLELEKYFLSEKLNQINYNQKTIYYMRIALPKNYISMRKKYFKNLIEPIALQYKIPIDLGFGLFLNLSYYNPLAKDFEPSYGIFNVTLHTIALYGNNSLRGHYKLISSSQLYDFHYNTQLAFIYLSKLYHKDFDTIVDIKSKKYICALCYKYPMEELFVLFDVNSKEQLIKEINRYNSDSLYKFLYKKLKNKEIQYFLYRLKWEMEHYEK